MANSRKGLPKQYSTPRKVLRQISALKLVKNQHWSNSMALSREEVAMHNGQKTIEEINLIESIIVSMSAGMESRPVYQTTYGTVSSRSRSTIPTVSFSESGKAPAPFCM